MTELSQLTPHAVARAALRGEATCRDVVQNLPYAVALLDEQLRIVMANRSATLLFNLSADRLRGIALATLIRHDAVATWLRDFRNTPTKVIETPLPRRTPGRPAPTLKITATLLPRIAGLRDGGVMTLLVLEDITDKGRLEQQLVDTEKQAAMGQLAAGILHEVSNPLASLDSNLRFVRRAIASSDAAVVQALDLSMEQLDQMKQLLGTLSGFTGRPAPRYEPADIHEIVRRSIAFIAKEAERRHIQLSMCFAPCDIDCVIDVRLIKQVFLNLLNNAMDAMPSGGRLDVKTVRRGVGPGRSPAVDIAIADTGVGIADADLRRIFRPLFSTKPHGAGLGLSFCRQAVEEHGGEIRVTSPGKNRGTVAIVSLPIGQTAPPE